LSYSARPTTGRPNRERAGTRARTVVVEIEEVLPDDPQPKATIARALGRETNDRSVNRALRQLVEAGRVAKTAEGWCVVRPLSDLVPTLAAQ